MQSDQLEEIREQWRAAQEYNKDSDRKFDSLERYCAYESGLLKLTNTSRFMFLVDFLNCRKYEQLSKENRDLIASVSRGEEGLKQTQVSDLVESNERHVFVTWTALNA